MNCAKCGKSFQDGFNFCPFCGKNQQKVPRKSKNRGNSSGTAYPAPNGKSWVAHVTVYTPERKQKKKSGFKTKTAALSYCNALRDELLKSITPSDGPKTLDQVYREWEPWYKPRVQSIAGYKAAYAYFHPIHKKIMNEITVGELQGCLDACERGKRTHQMMKVTAGLLWGYAADRNYVDKVITDNLYTGKGRSKKREALTDKEVEAIHDAIGKYRYAEYIYCQCYLGFRPGELLELRKDQLQEQNGIYFLTEGKKTDAGRDRIVTIPDRILPIILDRMYVPGTDLLFPMYTFAKPSKERPVAPFNGFKLMTDNYYRDWVFKPIMARLGIAEGKVPYGARHTYSNLLKKAEGDDRDKAALMGHSDYTFTQTHYQDTNLDERNKITKGL